MAIIMRTDKARTKEFVTEDADKIRILFEHCKMYRDFQERGSSDKAQFRKMTAHVAKAYRELKKAIIYMEKEGW